MENLFTIDSGVPELVNKQFTRKKNFVFLNKKVKGNFRGLILFYSPWCKSCDKFKYKWAELARLFKNRFFIGAVNVENQLMNNEQLRADLKITQYPTIKFVNKDGKITDYKGTKNPNDIIHFICTKERIDC